MAVTVPIDVANLVPRPSLRRYFAPLPRTMDATTLNAVANEPDIRRAMGAGSEPLDFSAILADPINFAFADDRGGFFVQHLGSSRYELHTLLTPAERGAAVLSHVADVIRFMFAETPCLDLVTRVPGNLKHADLMARRAGFREVWTLPDGWPGPDGPVDLRLFAITLDEWMARDPALVAEGEAFHALLSEAATKAGDNTPLHPTDSAEHDRAAGMACLMAKAGNHEKAIWAYGRWATLASFRPVRPVTLNPPVYDVGNALVQFSAGSMEILKWLPQQQ